MGIRINKYIKYLCNCILEVIYDCGEKCIVCNNLLNTDEYVCENCKKNISFCKEEFFLEYEGYKLKCYSIAYYYGTVKELILRLKYKNDFAAGQVLAGYMSYAININREVYDFLAFVPSSKKAFKNRGYNQSRVLAKFISMRLNIPIIDCLVRIKETKDQIGLNKIERWENMEESFEVKNKKIIYNKKIIVVDDVITTGATAFYCAKKLINNGVKEVIILTAAKSGV